MSSTRINPLAWIDLNQYARGDRIPPLSLLKGQCFRLSQVQEIKEEEKIPVIVVLPVRGDEEMFTLERQIQILKPLAGRIIDEIWIALGGGQEGAKTAQMARKYGVALHYDAEHLMGDVEGAHSGKGLAMRAVLHHLCTRQGLHHPRAIIEFIDGDIAEGYFNPHWVIDPVGALLWFKQIEVAKIVYHRPWGGRLNAFVAPFISMFDHPAIHPLTRLVYFLSGEIAATLRFWLSVPFKQNFGIEMKLLTALAFNRVQFQKGTSDLDRVLQVYLGAMDHHHRPLRSTRERKALDAMAKEVFQTFLEQLHEEGLIQFDRGLRFSDRFRLAQVITESRENEKWETAWQLDFHSAEKTFAPLKSLPEIQAACPWLISED